MLVVAATLGCTTAASAELAPATQPVLQMSSADMIGELHLAGATLAEALRLLSTKTRKNIVASGAVQGTVTADLFDVNFREALDSILKPNGCGYVEQGNFIEVYTLKELDDMRTGASRQLATKLFHLNYVSTADIDPVIRPLLSTNGKIAAMPDASKSTMTSNSSGSSGSSSGSSEGGTVQIGVGNLLSRPDCIVVYDHPERLAAIEQIISEIDVRPRQVLIEATILRATLGEENTLGIDFNVLGGVNFQEIGATSPGVTDLATGNLPADQFSGHSWTARTDFNDLVPRGGFTFGIIHNDVGAFIRAIESVTDATVLANPKVLTLNRQEGHVVVGRRDGYITTTFTETTATQTVEFLETGTRLFFRPFISNDGFVRLEVHPEDSSGGLNEQNLPFKRTTEVTTNIMVRDGCTVLIGGLFRESLSTTRSQVPLVGNIPIAGALVQTNSDSTDREEVIILLTVHVVKEDIYAAKSAEMAENTELVRLGARKGMQAYGRNRLAQAHYRWAVDHEEAGHYNRALWDARLALHLAPANLPALQLKERLVQRRETEREEGLIRDFIQRRLLTLPEPAATTPPQANGETPQ